MSRSALYICYAALDEPLVQTQVLPYLRALASHGVEFLLLSFEPRRPSAAEKSRWRAALAANGIRWHALRYHQRPSLPATLYDILLGSLWSLALCLRHRLSIVHARSHVAAAMALVVKLLLGRRLLFDMRGLLAEEYADAGHWRRGGLKYRLTTGMEKIFFRQSDAVVMLTRAIKEHLLEHEPALRGRNRDIQVIPCCVDAEPFEEARLLRAEYRAARNWEGRRVVVYLGKIGTWYLPVEMAEFFAALRRLDARFFLAVLTQSDPAPMIAALRARGVGPDAYSIEELPPADVPSALVAADAGLSFIRACHSKRASSPTKIGEYLAAGLPVAVNAGIGDCDELIRSRRVGLVLSELTTPAFEQAARDLLDLLGDPEAPERCRAVARDTLSLRNVGAPRYAALYEALFEGRRPILAEEAPTSRRSRRAGA